MPKQKISEFNSNPALNTDIDSINIAEGCSPSGINDAIRELMSQLKDWQSGTSNDPMVIGSSGSLTLNQGTANGVAYLNGSKVVTSGSALTFDGSIVSNTGVGFNVNNANALYRFQNGSGTRTGYLQVRSDAFEIWSDQSAIPMVFGTSNSEQMRLTSTGLGIGTSSPSYKLDVSATGTTVSSAFRSDQSQMWVMLKDSGTALGNVRIGSEAGSFIAYANGNQLVYNSSGNLGLGVTPSAWYSTYKALQVGSSGAMYNAGTNDFIVSSNAYVNASGTYTYLNTNTASYYEQYAGKHIWATAPSGTAGNAITFSQVMTLDASGRLLVGLTSGTSGYNIEAQSGASGTGIRASNSGGGFVAIEAESNATSNGVVKWTNDLKFVNSSGSERARIDSSGNLLVGRTSTAGFGSTGVQIEPTGQLVLFRAANSTVQTFYNFTGQTVAGTISIGTNTTSYNTSSDYRLKENIQPMTGALAKVAALKPCTYNWKADGSDGQGFIAHELAEVCPDAVSGEKDAVDENGNPKYQGIDTSFLVATLTAAIQELKAEFDAYKASHP